MRKIRVAKVLGYEQARLPTRKHPTDAGLDFFAYGNFTLSAGTSMIIGTGIAIALEPGYFGLLKAKSSSRFLVGAGVVDEGYRGEIKFRVFNPYALEDIVILHREPVGQLVVLPVVYPVPVQDPQYFSELATTERGTSGGIND